MHPIGGQCVPQWSVHPIGVSASLSGQCVPQWSVRPSVVSASHRGQCIPQWSVHPIGGQHRACEEVDDDGLVARAVPLPRLIGDLTVRAPLGLHRLRQGLLVDAVEILARVTRLVSGLVSELGFGRT